MIVHDPAVVGIGRDIGIELLDLRLIGGDEILDVLLGDQGVVWRDAGLAGIGQFAIGNATHGGAQWTLALDDDGRLASEPKRDRDQVFARRAHDGTSHRDAAGEQDVVEGQVRERTANLRISRHNGDLIRLEHLSQQGCKQ